MIHKTDANGNILKHVCYGGSLRETPWSLLIDDDGGFIVGNRRDNTNVADQNYTLQTWIYKTPPGGLIEWQYLSPPEEHRGAAQDMILTDDGSLVVASETLHEVDLGVSTPNFLYVDGYVFKLDSNHHLVWGTDIRVPNTGQSTTLRRIVEAIDGSGYVVAGDAYDSTPEELGGEYSAWIAKVSPEGDSLWSRFYQYFDVLYDDHKILDMRAAPDGGYILAGYAEDQQVSYQGQQAWLLKLDSLGCLVPGCQLVATENIEGNPRGVALRLYPNPASDILNIYTWSPHTPKNALLRIVSSDGQVVRESPVTRSDMTSMIPVRDIPAGVYFVQYVEEGMVVATEEAVIAP